MGTVAVKDRFFVTACSPVVQASNGQINPTPFTVMVLKEMFTGNRIELGPIPDSVGIQSDSLFSRTFNIFIRRGSTSLNFTINEANITQLGNTSGIFDIVVTKRASNATCNSSERLSSIPFLITCIAINEVPGFVKKGDEYIIAIFTSEVPTNSKLDGVFIQVAITRSKSPSITM